MENIIEDIKNTGYLENKKIGSIFHIKYPNLYSKILSITSEIEKTYVVNKKLRSRVIFIIKYNCDLSKLKNDDKWMAFDGDKDDFIKKSNNSAKKGWEDKINLLNEIEILTKEKTILELKKLTKNEIFGKSKNRILMSKNPVLYKSLEYHSSCLNDLNRSTKKFPSRIIFLRDLNGCVENLKCPLCENNNRLYNEEKKQFNATCKKCYMSEVPKYPQKEWFIKKYGIDWEKFYINDRNNIKSIKVNSSKWFINKYGKEIGIAKHSEYIDKKINNILNLKDKKVSKISQELFWEIYKNLDDKKMCYFYELNKEILLREGNQIFFPDFVYKNKIIEYDGIFWHDKTKDKIRNKFYNEQGYKVLVVTSDEFNKNKKDTKIIKKCLTFLKNEN
jgi:hypothetical protein